MKTICILLCFSHYYYCPNVPSKYNLNTVVPAVIRYHSLIPHESW